MLPPMRRHATANAVERRVVDYVGDPHGERTAAAIADMSTRGMRGLTGTSLLGADDDPSRTFTGVSAPPQHFTGVAALAYAPVGYRNGAYPTISEGIADPPDDNPAQRLFAERLWRRRR